MQKPSGNPKILKKTLRDFLIYFSSKSLLNLLQSKFIRKSKFDGFDNLKFALSISLISPIYAVTSHLTSSNFLAGTISSLALTLDRSSRSSTISQMVFVRVIYYLIRLNIYSSDTSTPKPSTSPTLTNLRKFIHKYGEYTTWSALAFYITYTCFAYPERVTKSFFSSLIKVTASRNRMGPHPNRVVRSLSRVIRELSSFDTRHEMELVPPGQSSLIHLQTWTRKCQGSRIGEALGAVSSSLILPPDIPHSQ